MEYILVTLGVIAAYAVGLFIGRNVTMEKTWQEGYIAGLANGVAWATNELKRIKEDANVLRNQE